MDFIKIELNNVFLLNEFISSIGSASSTFRYFENRKLDAIHNHHRTLLLAQDSNLVAYGHLDLDDNITWMGICVLPLYQNKGYGKIMVEKLIIEAKILNLGKIHAAVDNVNKNSIKMFLHFGFKTKTVFETFSIYFLDITN